MKGNSCSKGCGCDDIGCFSGESCQRVVILTVVIVTVAIKRSEVMMKVAAVETEMSIAWQR